MALSAALCALSRASDKIYLPALACWTLTRSAIDANMRIEYIDVSSDLRSKHSEAIKNKPIVEVRPWWGSLDNNLITSQTIIDLSINCSVTSQADRAFSCIISMGPSKPAYYHRHGGIIATSSDDVISEVENAINMYANWGKWMRLGPRLTPLPHVSDDVISAHFSAVLARQPELQEYAEYVSARLAAEQVSFTPLYEAELLTGNSYFLPLLVSEELQMPIVEIVKAAQAHKIPLGFQPVAPPYLQPAVKGIDAIEARNACPEAERISSKLIFTSSELLFRRPSLLNSLIKFSNSLVHNGNTYGR